MAYKIRPELGDKTERDARERIARAKTGKSYGEYRKLDSYDRVRASVKYAAKEPTYRGASQVAANRTSAIRKFFTPQGSEVRETRRDNELRKAIRDGANYQYGDRQVSAVVVLVDGTSVDVFARGGWSADSFNDALDGYEGSVEDYLVDWLDGHGYGDTLGGGGGIANIVLTVSDANT